MYWIEETLKGIRQLNNVGFIHCHLSLNNVVVDDNGNICVYNFDQCLRRDGCVVHAGRRHYKYSAPETMKRPRHSIYENVKHKINIDCFAVGVIAWELAKGMHAFANVEANSNLVAADMSVLYYNRKSNILSKFWDDLAEGGNMNHITTIMDIPLESIPNVEYLLAYYIIQLLRDGTDRLGAEELLGKFDEDDNNRQRNLWSAMLTGNGLISLNECSPGRNAGGTPGEDGANDP
jgi:serine/threonine protein kinase